jgi:5-bromo-4-chloroindolyl phosphate hydrolysis protein
MFKEKFAKLINVKTIITILLTCVFCFLCITGVIGAELFMTVFTVVIGFYFGNQASKETNTP